MQPKKVILRVFTMFILIFTFTPNGKANDEKFIGRYQHYWGPLFKYEKGDDLIDIKLTPKGLVATYTGAENEGEHGSAYFESAIDSITVTLSGAIQFVMPERTLYAEPPDKNKFQSPIGNSKPDAIYVGKLSSEGIVFYCTSKYYDCNESTMTFKKIK